MLVSGVALQWAACRYNGFFSEVLRIKLSGFIRREVLKMVKAVLYIFIVFINVVNVQAKISYTDNYQEIQKFMPSYTASILDGLIFKRQGDESDSFMHALGFHQVIKNNMAYMLTKDGLISSNNIKEAKRVPSDFIKNTVKPKSTTIEATWLKHSDNKPQKAEKISNILGGYGRLIINTDARKVTLPIELATSEKLAYYGAVAIPMGTTVTFPPEEKEYPIWAMSLGKHYTNGYLMTPKAGGWYLEWHTDRPHFHMPLSSDAGGFYILGKALDNNRFELTAFKIPFGTAVYTKRGAIHTDAGLTGKSWAVGYATSDSFSTVLLRNKQGEYVELVGRS